MRFHDFFMTFFVTMSSCSEFFSIKILKPHMITKYKKKSHEKVMKKKKSHEKVMKTKELFDFLRLFCDFFLLPYLNFKKVMKKS